MNVGGAGEGRGTSSTLYIPRPKTWIEYYQDIAEGKVNPYRASVGKNFIGTIRPRASGRSRLIPIDQALSRNAGESLSTPTLPSDNGTTTTTTTKTGNDVQMVSPAEQAVQQARAEIERQPETETGLSKRSYLKATSAMNKRRRKRPSTGRRKTSVRSKTAKRRSGVRKRVGGKGAARRRKSTGSRRRRTATRDIFS